VRPRTPPTSNDNHVQVADNLLALSDAARIAIKQLLKIVVPYARAADVQQFQSRILARQSSNKFSCCASVLGEVLVLIAATTNEMYQYFKKVFSSKDMVVTGSRD
jgi:hypothetical protein